MCERTGILLVGHGTRSDRGTSEFLTLARVLAQCFPTLPVVPAFLELRTPTIADAISQLAKQGVQRIIVTPLLLFAAGHAQRDIPSAVQKALDSYPGMTAVQTPVLECAAPLLELSQWHYEQVLPASSPESRSLLILVGRGSRDVVATAKMQEFADSQALRTRPNKVRVAFLAMAQPHIGDVLAEAAGGLWETVLVQPHLLFHGELLEELKCMVSEIANQHPQTQWRLTAHLAFDIGSGSHAERLLATAVCQLIKSAIQPPDKVQMRI